MVTMWDPVQEKHISFHVAPFARKALDNVKEVLTTKDQDRLWIVDGLEGSGKCQPSGSKVLMANGEWKNIEDVKIGDKVISPQKDGTSIFANVVNTTNWFCDDVYNIISINKKKKLYSCSGNHTLPIKYKQKGIGWILKYVTPREIINKSKKDFSRNNKSIISPLIPKFYGSNNCIIEPYTLGAMLGDGYISNKSLNITVQDKEIINEIEKSSSFFLVLKKKKIKSIRIKVLKIVKRTLFPLARPKAIPVFVI